MLNPRVAALLAAPILLLTPAAQAVAADTVNSYTPAQERRALAAAQRAGFTASRVLWAQAGNLFLSATKGGEQYGLTVVPSGEVHASTPLPAAGGAAR